MTATMPGADAAAGRPGGDQGTGWVAALYRARGWLWVVPTVPAAVLALLIMVVLPPDQTLDNVAEWAFKLSPFAFAVVAVALLPKWRAAPGLLLLGVIGYMAYIDTEMVMRIQEFGRNAEQDGSFEPVYQFELFITTFIVLFMLLAYRLGGARTANVLKTGVAAILVVVSGLNDLTFWALNDVWAAGSRPSELPWASHIIVFTGVPSVATAVVFMVVHVVLAAVVIALPVGRWVDRALGVEPARG
ncbi:MULTISPECIES: hypothetical protein [Prauserella salsuginis group]|uniref:Uncharacterized protein n=2 Tax=Prauserella salsuginis group TaxID=2893672 RepID=A0A839XS05_9PSEU|nr:hypothetical protein [Prauserella sediminis]MCR3721673.1 hypothetical protein [Prauserella flava]MCR3734365.1 hypothetical protein [Prauserella salsuginis]